MPARKIPKNYLFVTGLNPSRKGPEPEHKPYESPLERDYYCLLEFDRRVLNYEPQPFKIPYTKPDGRPEEYYPDTYVQYRPALGGTPTPRNELVEVKPRDELRKIWTEYKPALRAAWRYARPRGWRFVIKTDREIRTPYLENVKFLLRHRGIPADAYIEAALIEVLGRNGRMDPTSLIGAIWSEREDQARAIPYLWHLLANYRINVDLTQPLTMRSVLWNCQP